ncbi:MAG: hypothetical protein EP338_01255 [Bacteroidetes bacterium]|nr:MAG: hypothetical protein EP338_01255 [Bacteroidota bacterium]
MTNRKHILLPFLLCFVIGIQAQEVNLEVSGNRTVEPAYRITKQPHLIDTVIPYSSIQYPLLTLKYDNSFELDTIRSARIKLVDKLDKLYPGYVRLGLGNAILPLFQLHYGSTRSRKFVYDARIHQLNSIGKVNGYAPANFNRNQIELSGKLNERKYSVKGDLHFNTLGLHQYGIPSTSVPADSISQRYSDFGTSVYYEKHRKDSMSLNYALGASYNYFRDKKPQIDSLSDWFAHENNIGFLGKIWYLFNDEIIQSDFITRYNSFAYGVAGDSISAIDTGIVYNNLQLLISPNITTFARNNRLKMKFGARLALDVNDDRIQPVSKVYLYPDVELKYSLFNDIFIPYLIVSGDLEQQTLKSLSRQNEFILSQILPQSENRQMDTRLGMKGTLSNKFMFNTSASYRLIKNKALFVQDTLYSRSNRFRVIYDDINEIALNASLIYEVEKLQIQAAGCYHIYQTKNEAFPWNLPAFELNTSLKYSLDIPLQFKLDASAAFDRKAQVFSATESDQEKNGVYAKNLGTILDLNFEAEYRYTNRFSAFLQFNNFAAQRYARWYNYPVLGFQVIGGISFRF